MIYACTEETIKINISDSILLSDKLIEVKLQSNDELKLSWKKAVSKFKKKKLYYAVFKSEKPLPKKIHDIINKGTKVKDYTEDLTEFVVKGLIADKVYYFAVVVRDENKKYNVYDIVTFKLSGIKIADNTITANNITQTGADLIWEKAISDQRVKYSVYVSERKNINSVDDVVTNGTLVSLPNALRTFTVTTLKANKTYYLNVFAENAIGFKAVYKTVQVTTLAPSSPPPVPVRKIFNEGNLTFTVHESYNVTSLQMPPALYNEINTDYKGIAKFPMFTKLIYKHFKGDAFDFIIFCNAGVKPSTLRYHGIFTGVKNEVKGIGSKVSAYWNKRSLDEHGATDRLQGVLHLSTPSNIRRGPSLHELLHRWGNRIIDAKMIRNGREVDAIPHWGYTDVGGQLGGFDRSTFKDLGGKLYEGKMGKYPFGTIANGGNGVPYSKLELYLMGLIPKSEVPNIRIFSGLVGVSSSKVPNRYQFLANNIKTITIDDIIAEHGERVPKPANAQKKFNILVVYLTSSKLTDARWTQFSNDVKLFTKEGSDGDADNYNFWEATVGRAALKANELNKALK